MLFFNILSVVEMNVGLRIIPVCYVCEDYLNLE